MPLDIFELRCALTRLLSLSAYQGEDIVLTPPWWVTAEMPWDWHLVWCAPFGGSRQWTGRVVGSLIDIVAMLGTLAQWIPWRWPARSQSAVVSRLLFSTDVYHCERRVHITLGALDHGLRAVDGLGGLSDVDLTQRYDALLA
jgi:hypothetical protein